MIIGYSLLGGGGGGGGEMIKILTRKKNQNKKQIKEIGVIQLRNSQVTNKIKGMKLS